MVMGASKVVVNKQVGSVDKLIIGATLEAAIGFPPCQLRELGWLRSRGTYTLGHPPICLSPVALSWWPAFLSRQVKLVCFGFFVYPWEWQ
jgi:hypothetical protein